MTALENLLALAPCYRASAAINILLTMAEAETGPLYGNNRNKAVALLALHWMAIQERGRGAAPGAITAEAEGDLSRSYAATATTSGSSDLQSTSWGLMLLRLRKGSFVTGMRTRMDYYGGSC